MGSIGLGAGLSALAFWGFLAVVVAAYYWDSARKRESRHETLRRIVESGRDIDRDLMDKLLTASRGTDHLDRDLKVAGLICLSVAPGLALLGWMLSFLSAKTLMPLLGVAALMLCIAIGLLVAARAARGDGRDAHTATFNPPRG